MNSTIYFINGINSFINGKRYGTRTIKESGSWQKIHYAKGYNSLCGLFETTTAHDTYCNKVWRSVLGAEKQLKKVYLNVTRQGKDYEIEFPIALCPVSKMREILTKHGFTCNHLTA